MTGSLKNIWMMMEGQRLRYLMAIISMMLASVFVFVIPLISQITIDGALNKKIEGEIKGDDRFTHLVIHTLDARGGENWLADHLWLAALVMGGLAVMVGVLMFLRGMWTTQASEWIAQNLRSKVFDHLQRLPVLYHDGQETGDLIQRCSTDVDTVKTFFLMHLAESARIFILVGMGLPLMFYTNWKMALISIICVPFIVGFSGFFFWLVKTRFKEAEEAEGKMTSVLQENLEGIRVVRAFSQQESEKTKFAGVNEKRRQTQWTLYRIFAVFWATGDLLVMSQMLLIIGFGIYFLQNGQLTVGGFYAYIAWSQLYLWPVRMLGRVLAELGRAQVAIRRLGEILAEPLEVPEPEDQVIATPALTGQISMKEVSFKYHEDADFELQKINLNIEAGETVAFLGPSGGGKTSILSLLMRLYDGYEGSITLDGRELKTLEKRSLRERIAVVLQTPFLASRSIQRNIKLGRIEAHDEEMIEAASMAAIHESIKEFEKGYDTVVGEKGVTLSGGQRQRVAIARALLQDTPFLVLDDSLSAVDTRTERHILSAVEKAHGHRTVLMVAHRVATLSVADRIVVLEEGRISQVGNHEQLIQEDGLYQRLWQSQNAFEAEAREEMVDAAPHDSADQGDIEKNDREGQEAGAA